MDKITGWDDPIWKTWTGEIRSIYMFNPPIYVTRKTTMNIKDILDDVLEKLYDHQDKTERGAEKLDKVIESINDFLDEDDDESGEE